MIDQLVIGNKRSFDDFEASVKERAIKHPKKKSIKETVPFSNITHDFSAINGEIYWEERTLEYVFEIMEMTPELLEEKKRAFLSWIMNVSGEKLHDPFIKDYHFIATYDDSEADDIEVEKSTIRVTFTAYPYMIANKKRLCVIAVGAGTEESVNIINDSSHRITPTFISNIPVAIQTENATYFIGAGETTDDSFKLEAGANRITIQNASGAYGTVQIEFYEEVF